MRPIFTFGAAFLAVGGLSRHTLAAPAELRGTWLTTTANTAIATPANTAATMQNLRSIGLNTTYVEVWKNGFTEFPSQTMQNLIGVSSQINASPGVPVQQRDLLAETLIESHRNGLTNIAWFEYGLMAKFGNPGTSSTDLAKYMADRGWLLQNSAGSFTTSSQGFSWMNPAVPQVRSLVKGIIMEAVRNYDLDGIQLDDHVGWPVQFGYDNYTRDAYLAETGLALPANPNNTQFKAWRASKVTSLMQEIIAEVKAVRPNMIVTVSPAVGGWAYDNFMVDWPAWQQQGMFDEFVPQVYRSSFSDFNRDWDGTGSITTQGQIQYMGNRRHDFAAGIAINTSPLVSWTDAQQMVNLVRSTTPAVAGHVWWYSSSVLTTYPTQMAAYYDVAANGPAARPDLPEGWRAPSTVAVRDASNLAIWTAAVPADGRYRIIRKLGSTWTEISNGVFGDGFLVLNLPGVDQVELLIDRRPYLVGDANLNGAVNLDDFTVLAANFGQTGKLWVQGDFTLDGTINLDDFTALAASFGQTLPGEAAARSSIPEPGGLAIVAVLAAAARRRRC
ncbi:MAG TPA: family 10 glycosylhydrolase [Tepidisphaeraceae bacterium]|nr:family 10 glycosylhydrolase [Tepidisphaeraceae bacterium]